MISKLYIILIEVVKFVKIKRTGCRGMYSASWRGRPCGYGVHWFNLQRLRFKKQLVSIVRRRQANSATFQRV